MRIAMLLHKSVEFDSRVRREASALAAAGHDVTVLELAPVPAGADWLDGFRRVSSLPPGWIRQRLPSPVYRSVMLLYFVAGVIRLDPDVIHAHDAAMLMPGLLGARLTGARLVYDSHELASSVPYRERAWAWFVTAIERAVVPRCAAVITVSDGIAARLRERYRLPATPTVVRNVSALQPGGSGGLRQQLGVGSDDPVVLHQGAPAPDRGCEVLVDAVAMTDGVHLAFLGDPEPGYGERLLARIRERGIEERVSLLPSVPLNDLLAWTGEADVGVTLLQDSCENHRLALPNKLFEYIAAGVPVVASALPETQALVDRYGVGWCVEPADVGALASALEVALRERANGDRRGHLALAADELSWAREKTRLLALYDSLSESDSGQADPLVLLLVRNSVSGDARVLRAARTAERSLGARALIVGVAADGIAGEAVVDGIRVIRLRPWGRLGSLRGRSVAPATPARASARPGPALAPSPPSWSARMRRRAAGLAFALQAIAIARRERPAVVHANDWNTMWAGIAIKLSCRCQLVYDSHELWPDRNGRWESRGWLIACEALFVRIADNVLTTSPGHAQAIAMRYRVSEPLVVRNIPEWVAPDGKPQHEPRLVVYIGGLMPGRGLEQMITAMPQVPQIALRAIGPGAEGYRSQLEAAADSAGVADRVELRPAVPPSEIRSQLAGAAAGLCLIQPICRSYDLSLPNKLLEYAAGGVPILASDVPVIAQVVRDNHLGEVVRPDDPESIADGVRRLLDPRGREAALQGIRAFVASNTWDRERELLAAVYRTALEPSEVRQVRG
jgi:glycosyltransferase involved in cell wall biosynthesis